MLTICIHNYLHVLQNFTNYYCNTCICQHPTANPVQKTLNITTPTHELKTNLINKTRNLTGTWVKNISLIRIGCQHQVVRNGILVQILSLSIG